MGEPSTYMPAIGLGDDGLFGFEIETEGLFISLDFTDDDVRHMVDRLTLLLDRYEEMVSEGKI